MVGRKPTALGLFWTQHQGLRGTVLPDCTGPAGETEGAAGAGSLAWAVLCFGLTFVVKTLILPLFQATKTSKETFGCQKYCASLSPKVKDMPENQGYVPY